MLAVVHAVEQEPEENPEMLYVRKRESWPNGLSDNTEDL
jgi:hypothetical protein